MTPEALATLLSDPARADALPRRDLPQLLGQVERLRAHLWVQISQPPENGDAAVPDVSPTEDRLLNAEEVAEILGTDTRYVYRHADEWKFTRRLSKGTLRFSRAGLHRWIERSGK